MEEKRKAPELRFPGFADDWEQRKFGDLYKKVSEKNDLSYGVDDIISVANMYYKEDVRITDSEYLKSYNVFHVGDIAFEGNRSKKFAHGRFVENTIGNGIISHVFDVFRPKMEYDLYFWKYFINDEQVMGRILTRCTKASTMMTSLVAKDFLREGVLVPSLEEQDRIGKFLKSLDEAIALHQRKENLLRELKKGMLQKIFSQEIRFKDDNGQNFPDWENKKLGELVTFQNGFNGGKECFGTGMPLISVNEVLSDSPVFHDNIKGKANIDDETQSRFLVEYGDILFQRSSETREEAGSSNVYLDKSHPAIFGGFVIRGKKKENYCPEFIRYVLKAEFVRHEIFKLAQGAQHINIGQDMLSTLKVDFPSIPEQKKIANVLSDIEKRITAEQKKVSSLQTMKKGFLQKMFV